MTTGKQPRVVVHPSGDISIDGVVGGSSTGETAIYPHTRAVDLTPAQVAASVLGTPAQPFAGEPGLGLGMGDSLLPFAVGFASRPPTTLKHPELESAVRVFHRQPNPASSDRSVPRMVDLDEYMAIQPSAVERAFFGLFDFEDEDAYEMHGSVAVLSIDGPLMQRGGWFYDGYQSIRGRLEKALDDRDVTAVVLKINSPGGVCSGCFSAARAMRAMKEDAGKPVLAYADESAFSAAYAMACIADEIYLPPEGGVGSVGVIGVLEDWTAYNDRVGIKVAVIRSGAYKADGHPDVPLTKDVVDRYQARINTLARSFADVVAASRGMTAEAVLKLEAACLYGEEAVTAGLANGVATFEETVAKAQSKGGPATTRARSLIGSLGARKGHSIMSTKTTKDAQETTATAEAFLEVSYGEFALSVGLSHDAAKGDILAKIATDRASADATRASLAKALEACGAKTTEELIGKFSAKDSVISELVAAITGDEKASAADALAKLVSDRKANEAARAKSLIESASAAGKTAGPKALELFEKHGLAALEAHLDALVPHAALTETAPKQKSDEGASKPGAAASEGEVVLSADDKRFCEVTGISEEAFIKARKDELAVKAANERLRNS